MSLQFGDDGAGTMDVSTITAGHGLLNVTASGPEIFYMVNATWSKTGSAIASFNYSDIETHKTAGIYLHNAQASSVIIPATAKQTITDTQSCHFLRQHHHSNGSGLPENRR